MSSDLTSLSTVEDDLVRDYLLETTIAAEHVEHRIPYSDPDRGIRRGIKSQKWHFGKVLGRGGFGVVSLQVEADTKQLRAVKEVDRSSQSASIVNPLRELVAMAAVSKDQINFVNLQGWYQDDAHLYIAMEYFKHGDLDACVRPTLPEAQAQAIVFQLTEAMKFMHEHDFAHRDLKPSNVFVFQPGPSWWVKVADFGISKRYGEHTSLHTSVVSDWRFMSPELAGFSDDMSITSATDMWSVGCIAAWLIYSEPLIPQKKMFAFCNGKFTMSLDDLTPMCLSYTAALFISSLLKYQPQQRLTASAALQHEWLLPYTNFNEREKNESPALDDPTIENSPIEGLSPVAIDPTHATSTIWPISLIVKGFRGNINFGNDSNIMLLNENDMKMLHIRSGDHVFAGREGSNRSTILTVRCNVGGVVKRGRAELSAIARYNAGVSCCDRVIVQLLDRLPPIVSISLAAYPNPFIQPQSWPVMDSACEQVVQHFWSLPNQPISGQDHIFSNYNGQVMEWTVMDITPVGGGLTSATTHVTYVGLDPQRLDGGFYGQKGRYCRSNRHLE